MKELKFKVGDKVIVKGARLSKPSEVLGFIYNEDGFLYKITSVEVDVAEKKLINGVSFHREDELKLAKKEEKDNE